MKKDEFADSSYSDSIDSDSDSDSLEKVEKVVTYAMPNYVRYSERYADDKFEYRHVIITSDVLQLCKNLGYPEKFLTEEQLKGMGIQQSRGWIHYAYHNPERNILLFKRPLQAVVPNTITESTIGEPEKPRKSGSSIKKRAEVNNNLDAKTTETTDATAGLTSAIKKLKLSNEE